jgi:DNA end-binding protein Ku
MASTIAKVSISFGLVSIPVRITAAARGVSYSFNMLHDECKHRINMKTWCSHCDKEISRSQTVKGYEVEKDGYLTLTEDDMKSIEPRSTRVLEITSAVSMSEIDPILFDASYYLEPEPAGKRGFALLVAALEKQQRAAVAKITMHQHEHVVIIRPYKHGLMFHTMYFEEEIRQAPAVTEEKVNPAELKLACQLLDANAAPFEHATYKNEYNAAVEALIDAKQKKRPVPINKKPVAKEPVMDIAAQLAAAVRAANSKKKAV